MIQSKIFSGTIAEVEAALNAWLVGVLRGAQLTFSPLVVISPEFVIKEVIVNFPEREVNGNRAPKLVVPQGGV